MGASVSLTERSRVLVGLMRPTVSTCPVLYVFHSRSKLDAGGGGLTGLNSAVGTSLGVCHSFWYVTVFGASVSTML